MVSKLPKSLQRIKRHDRGPKPFSVLVRVKNERPALEEFWKRLSSQSSFDDAEVIFLDSGSTDGTLDYLTGLPCSIYWIEAGDFSFGSSCNVLMSLSSAPIAVFLSGHVLLTKPTNLEIAVERLHTHPLSGAYLRQVPNSIFGFNTYEKTFMNRRFPSLDRSGPVLRPLNAPCSFSNAASAITRGAWSRHPFPDVRASEDHMWAEAHIGSGGKLFYFSDLEVMHSHNESPESVYQRVRLNAEARHQQHSLPKAALCLGGIFCEMVRHGAGVAEAWRYASSHAYAYL